MKANGFLNARLVYLVLAAIAGFKAWQATTVLASIIWVLFALICVGLFCLECLVKRKRDKK